MAKRRYGEGSIDQRGENQYRLRYRVDGKSFSTTFHGTSSDARRELRRIVRSGDVGEHVAPDRLSLDAWITHWIGLLERKDVAPGVRRRGLVNPRTAERYAELLKHHVQPTLGAKPIQYIRAADLDALYLKLERTLAPRTVHHVHTVLKNCLGAAVRKAILTSNPADRAETPRPGESDVGQVLDEKELGELVKGFRDSPLFPIVATAAFTGARRNEILALRWLDLDAGKKELRIERAIEDTRAYGRTLKEPKTARGKRTITIVDELVTLLLAERERYLRIVAGIPNGAAVDLALVKLPVDALMFPAPPAPGESLNFAKLRDPHAVTHTFKRRACQLGFLKLRFHDLRASHETVCLDHGMPVHVVAARCGHDPAVLLRTYAKRTPRADKSAAAVIGAWSKGIL